jgi:hypothetical protein
MHSEADCTSGLVERFYFWQVGMPEASIFTAWRNSHGDLLACKQDNVYHDDCTLSSSLMKWSKL